MTHTVQIVEVYVLFPLGKLRFLQVSKSRNYTEEIYS